MRRALNNNFYTTEEREAAKRVNIAQFLLDNNYELERVGHCYKGKLHDSLVIHDDGRWYWNSRQKKGYSPIDLYKFILMEDYGYTNELKAAIEAVKQLAGSNHVSPLPTAADTAPPKLPRLPDEPLPIPAPYKNNNRVMAYLCKTRGLDADIVKELMQEGKIYETVQSWDKDKKCFYNTPYHNAVFLSFDEKGRPQNGFLRSTISNPVKKPFRRDLDFIDKSFPFTVSGRPDCDRVSCFESAIDAISHASIYKMAGVDWRSEHRISLGGISFMGLERFLKDNPQVTKITAALDNDPTGNRYCGKLNDEYSKRGYEVIRKASIEKDWNEDLIDDIEMTLKEQEEQTGGMVMQ